MNPELKKGAIGAGIGIAIMVAFILLGFWRGALVVLGGLAGWWLATGRKISPKVQEIIDRIRAQR